MLRVPISVASKPLQCKPQALWAQALLIQCTSMLLITLGLPSVTHSLVVFELIASLSSRLDLQVSVLMLGLLLHVLCVSGWAWLWRMPSWWRLLHVLFPLAVVVFLQFHLPQTVYLAGFLIMLSLYWSVHLTRVPFYPSFPATWHAVVHRIDAHAGTAAMRVLDIGSGIGDAAFYFAKQRPQDQVMGIEIAPLPWLISQLRSKLGGHRVQFLQGDYQTLNFADHHIIFAYLSPAVMSAVWQKACREMRPNSLLISSEFAIPNVTPTHTIWPKPGTPTLYVYRF